MEDIMDLEIKGSGGSSGGNYKNVIIKGEGKIDGDLNCVSLEIQGRCEVKGNLKAESVKVLGHHSVKGNLEAEKIEIQGETDVGEDLSVENAVIRGMIQVNGNCNAETFAMEGAFTIRGLLNTGELDLDLHGPSEAREIGGEKITVKRKDKPRFTRLKKMITPLGFSTCLTTDVIEGDEIYLEYTTAKIVRGNDVELGLGCEIKMVEYKDDFKQDHKAEVKTIKQV